MRNPSWATNWLIRWTSRIRRSIEHRIRHLHDDEWYVVRMHCTLFARTVRLRLIAAGIPIRKEYLLMRCWEGSEATGLFSEFRVVLGLLDHYDKWKTQYAGLRIDFATQGLYYDAAFGANWWEYYFEPVEIGSTEGALISEVSPFRHGLFAEQAEELSRERGFEIIDRYIRLKPRIRDKIESYVREHFTDAFVVGIHYRGTDKSQEAPRAPYEEVRAAILDVINTAKPVRYKLFLATDEQAFLDYMRELYPGGLLFRDMFRSADGRPIDVVNEDRNHKKGEDAVIDCLLLSRCQHLIRTASNLSLCSTLFSLEMPVRLLNPPR